MKKLLSLSCLLILTIFACDPDNTSGGGDGGGDGNEGVSIINLTDCRPEGDILLSNHVDGPDYRIDCEFRFDSGVLKIEPGVEIIMGANASLEIRDGGHIEAIGAAGDSIIFRGESGLAGSWKGIGVSSNDPRNEFNHCIITDAGGDVISVVDDRGALVAFRVSGVNAKISVSNTRISNSAGYGFIVDEGTDRSEVRKFSNVHFSDLGIDPILSPADNVHQFNDLANNIFTWHNAGCQCIVIKNSQLDLSSDVVWEGLLYKILDELQINAGSGLTINTGFFGMEPNSMIDVKGFLRIENSSFQFFPGDGSDLVGVWKGIYFDSDDVRNYILNSSMKNAGSDKLFTSQELIAGVAAGFQDRVTIENLFVRYSGGCGVYVDDDATVVFEDNGVTGDTNVGDLICYE